MRRIAQKTTEGPRIGAILALCSLCPGRSAPTPSVPPRSGGILDCRCAQRSALPQVGTKGWPIRSNKGINNALDTPSPR